MSALQLARRNRSAQQTFQELREQWKLFDDLFLKLQKFTCQMYTSTPATEDVNTLRYMLFCAKKGEVESNQLPPCADSLRKQTKQTRVWRQNLIGSPDVPSPVGSGWCLETKEGGTTNLTIDWMEGDPAPKAVLQLLSCKSARSCKLPDCSCIQNGLKCTDMCRLKDCQNCSVEDNNLEKVINSLSINNYRNT